MENIGNISEAAKILEDIVRMRIDIEKDLKCKYCDSHNIVRNGHSRNKQQRYLCKKCGSVFIDNEALPRMQISVRQLGEVIGQYYGGMSLKELRRQFEQQHGKTLSRSSFDRWLIRFSKIAVDEASKYHPKVGDKWIADETVLKIGGKNIWCWDIIDSDTRFLLATHLSLTRTTRDAQALMEKAKSVASKAPKVVLTDSLRAYIDGIELTWGSETRHIQSQPFAEADISTNKIERFHSTLKTRTEIMRGLKSLKTAQALLDGWLVHYNFFRSHESINDKTPAEEAGVKFPYKDWLDVIEAQSPKHSPEVIKSLRSSPRIYYKTKHRGKIRKKQKISSGSLAMTLKQEV